jgi:hypothetical protein
MSPAAELDALRKMVNRQPRISLARAIRTIREREAIRAKAEQLRAEESARRVSVRMWAAAGATEGLI